MRIGFLTTVLMLFSILPAWPGRIFFSYSAGWSSYQAGELNAVMLALESQASQSGGLNHYGVDQFDGHPRQAVVIGAEWNQWKLGLEAEFWVEDFSQSNVPFYLNKDLDPRFAGRELTCAELQVEGFVPVSQGVAGCLNAQEIFTIVPLTMQLSRHWDFVNNHLSLGAGLAAGILAGDARLIVQTDFLGESARPDDRVDIDLYPGINPVFKAFGDLEYRPWSFMGIGLRAGWRYSEMRHIEVSHKAGDSFLLGLILGDDSQLAQGDRVWLVDQGQSNLLVIRGDPNEQEIRQAELAGNHWNLVQGDFSGWILELKVNLRWEVPHKRSEAP